MDMSIQRLILSGESDFKGRNGYARLAAIDYGVVSAACEVNGQRHHINFHSKRPGEPPAKLVLSDSDLAAFKVYVACLGAVPQAAPGRIEVLGWREHGDDDDSTEVAVFAADDKTHAQDLIAEEHHIQWGDNADGLRGYINTDHEIRDGQCMTSHDGRKFRVSITEVKA